eukprot:GEMP01007524.1.p1 GENE.GEMP01007524.1~~GEMP01007524.1.p1  ORF type:complete len:664 (+),score=108.16 GEMP01007524.1:100-2091(+)
MAYRSNMRKSGQMTWRPKSNSIDAKTPLQSQTIEQKVNLEQGKNNMQNGQHIRNGKRHEKSTEKQEGPSAYTYNVQSDNTETAQQNPASTDTWKNSKKQKSLSGSMHNTQNNGAQTAQHNAVITGNGQDTSTRNTPDASTHYVQHSNIQNAPRNQVGQYIAQNSSANNWPTDSTYHQPGYDMPNAQGDSHNAQENDAYDMQAKSMVDEPFDKWNPAHQRLMQNTTYGLLKWDESSELADARYEILHFRTVKCPYEDECPRKDSGYCDRAHTPFQVRRCPVFPDGRIRYSNVKCPMIAPYNYECQMGSSCPYAHTASEITYHPLVYRTRKCQVANCRDLCCSFAHSDHEIRNGMELCGAGKCCKTRFCAKYPAPCDKLFCKWAHSRDDIQAELLTEEEEAYVDEDNGVEVPAGKLAFFLKYRYKTMPCPIGKVHNWQTCAYAHGAHDIRRDPRVHKYSAVQCVHRERSFDNICPFRNECKNAHGIKEMMYHPDNMRSKECLDFMYLGSCRLGKRCPHLHSANKMISDHIAEDSTSDSLLEDRLGAVQENQDCDAKIYRLFYHFDKDEDGYLSHAVELREFVCAIGSSPLCEEEYEALCDTLGKFMELSRPDIGLSLDEFEASYRQFGSEIVDRDYDFVFKTVNAAANDEHYAASRYYATTIPVC